jgi:hypothetical protein
MIALRATIALGDYVVTEQSADAAASVSAIHSVVLPKPEVAWSSLLGQLAVLSETGPEDAL